MRKLTVELIGTCFLVFTVGIAVSDASPRAAVKMAATTSPPGVTSVGRRVAGSELSRAMVRTPAV